MADSSPIQSEQGGCDGCGYYKAATGEIGEQRDANVAQAKALEDFWRQEDVNIPRRRIRGLTDFAEQLELQKMLCTAKGDQASCAIARFCISMQIQDAQEAPFRRNGY